MTLLAVVACGGDPTPHAIDPGQGDGGPGASTDGGVPGIPWAVTPFPDVADPVENPTTAEKVALGRLLFYDPIASADRQVACATCHSEVWGMTDGLAVSVGLGAGPKAGPGRDGPHKTRRNAPTLWNVALREHLFWDGRAASLEEQIHFPFESVDEFDRPLADVASDLRAIPEYVSLFAAAFPADAEAVTETNVTRALGAFERKILSKRGLYDAYLEGDTLAMSGAMLHGAALFAEVGCPTCHVPPLFASARFEDRGVPPIPGVTDEGRYEATHDEADRGRFEVPTLRNLHDSAPYFHTGAVNTVREAVALEAAQSAETDGARALSEDELTDLTAFIEKGLFDSRNSPTRPYEVPSGLQVPIDGFAIRR